MIGPISIKTKSPGAARRDRPVLTMTKESAHNSMGERQTTAEESNDYNFFLSVLSEVLPNQQEEKCSTSEEKDGPASIHQSPPDFGRHSLREREGTVPLEVILLDNNDDDDESEAGPCFGRNEPTIDEHPKDPPPPAFQHTVDALSQLSVSESIGSLPRSRGTPGREHRASLSQFSFRSHRSDDGGNSGFSHRRMSSSGFIGSFSNHASRRTSDDDDDDVVFAGGRRRRQRSQSLCDQDNYAPTRLVRDQRSFFSDDACSQPPRRPSQALPPDQKGKSSDHRRPSPRPKEKSLNNHHVVVH
mmetsp:Transcript_23071/g.50230  ORF Transcript_23071/g.50230 Transcript_23071/m.50230 type:complete len:301 (-) Transcript_23071:12-914(-)